MKDLTSKKLMKLWRQFWNEKKHTEIEGASLIPADNSVLFTTAGMQPLVPYLLGKPHPMGTRLFNIQPCLRTNDIEEVGDNRHHTLFFMLGNWSLGDYFKKEAITWSWEFLTDAKWLGIPKNRLAVTVFAGDEDVPRDDYSASIWKSCGMDADRIFYFPKKDNWWEVGGGTGPCGPDTEIFFDTGKPACSEHCDPSCDCGKWVEIWNNVFMEFIIDQPGSPLRKLPQQNVDTGMGMERVVSTLNGFESTYQNDCFEDSIALLEKLSGTKFDFKKVESRPFAIICDHLRASVFLLGDLNPTTPSNTGQGYVLRRLIRSAVNSARALNIQAESLTEVAKCFLDFYAEEFPNFRVKEQFILDELTAEIVKFQHALEGGLKEFNRCISTLKKGDMMDGKTAFRLFDTFGFPVELTCELCCEKGIKLDKKGFNEALSEHQQKSRDNSGAMFKGGVGQVESQEDQERVARLHTATHLLNAALRKVLGDKVEQRGSNITPERLRFDFLCDHKMTPEELAEVEKLVNQAIAADIQIECQEMTLQQAKESGAIGIFESKYGDKVKVYTVGEFSREICGGPHAKRTGELGEFVIQKEESSSSGIRRIKAILK